MKTQEKNQIIKESISNINCWNKQIKKAIQWAKKEKDYAFLQSIDIVLCGVICRADENKYHYEEGEQAQ